MNRGADFPGRDTVCNASCVKLQLLAIELLELMNSNGRIFRWLRRKKSPSFWCMFTIGACGAAAYV